MSSADCPHPPIAAPLGDVVTERLELRRLRPGDLDGLARVFAKREVWEFPFGRGFSPEETATFLGNQITQWQECGFGLWAASERASDDPSDDPPPGSRPSGDQAAGPGASRPIAGFAGLSIPRFLPEILPAVEVGWRLDPAVWGRGYATEAAGAALTEAFTTLGLDEVCAVVQAGNTRSVRVAERLGMRLVRPVEIPPNERRSRLDALLFTITATEWLARRRGQGFRARTT